MPPIPSPGGSPGAPAKKKNNMDIFANFATDETREIEGTWFNLSKTARVKVARAGNPKYIKALRKKLDENRLDLDSKDDESNELAEKLISDVMAETILLDWEGLEFRGKPMTYSSFNARLLLQIKDFRKKIGALSESFEAFKVKEEAEQGNASPSTSAGA